MSDNHAINRRNLLKAAGATGLSLAVLTSQARAAKVRKRAALKFNNDDFYTADGKFDPEAAKDAYIRLMKYHRYPLFEGLRDRLWVSDYGIGEFTKLGLGAICFINDEESSYLGQDLYLLPGQMLPEHYHLKTDKCPPKMEGWHVRHGMIYTLGEGEPTDPMPVELPASQAGHITVNHADPVYPGEVARLNRKMAKHFMIAGSEGAIVTEYGSYHDGEALRFTNPGVAF